VLEGAYNYSIGIGAKYAGVHSFSLKYVDSHTPHGENIATDPRASSGSVQNSHGWISFTYKTTF
jgi:hypothetical protein